MTRRTYKTPPIEEALCEIAFAPSADWDLTIPGRFHEALKAEYPGRPRQQRIMTAQVVFNVNPAGQAPPLSMVETPGRVQFPSADDRRLVAVGPDVLSIHVLKPYPGWDDFRPRIERAITTYATIVAPDSRVIRVGLRYINRIELKDSRVRFEQYFRCGLPHLEGIPETTSAFLHRDEYDYDDGVKLIVTFASLEAQKDAPTTAFLLDLDLVALKPEGQPLSVVLSLVDELRNRERLAFESLITDNLRGVFDAQ